MAEKKEEIVLERIYVVPLRRIFLRASKWKRAIRAVKAVREFAMKHMKSENVKLGGEVNELILSHSMQHPPSRVKVVMRKNSEGVVRVSLPESEKKAKKEEPKKAEKKPEVKKLEPKKSEAKKEIKEEPKKEIKK